MMDWMKITEDLILNMNATFAFTILIIVGGVVTGVGSWRATRRPKVDPRLADFTHEEKMAELQARHEEAILKINRETPKVIENTRDKAPKQIDGVAERDQSRRDL